MRYRLPTLLLLSAGLLSACGGGGSSTPPTENPPPGNTTPGNPPPGDPPPATGVNTASFTFKALGSPVASLAPLTGANGVVAGTFSNPDVGIRSGLAIASETVASGRIGQRIVSILFRNRAGTFKVGDRLQLYDAGTFLSDPQPNGANVGYKEKYRSGDTDEKTWTSLSGTLVIKAIGTASIQLSLENAVMSEILTEENNAEKFTINGTINYDPRPR